MWLNKIKKYYLNIHRKSILKFLCLRLLLVFSPSAIGDLLLVSNSHNPPPPLKLPPNKHKTKLPSLQKDQRELIIVICSNQDNLSCWSVPKPTEGSYFISRDNLFLSVCHMVLQLQRSNRFVDVNFSSVLKKFLSRVGIFIMCLNPWCQPGLLDSRISLSVL